MFAGKWGEGRACAGQDETHLLTCEIIPFIIRGTTGHSSIKFKETRASFGGA